MVAAGRTFWPSAGPTRPINPSAPMTALSPNRDTVRSSLSCRRGSVPRFEAVIPEPLSRPELPLDDGPDHVAVWRIGMFRIEPDDARFDAPGQSDDAQIRADGVDYGSPLEVAHRRAGDAIAAGNVGKPIGPEADFAHLFEVADGELRIPECALGLGEPAGDCRQHARVFARRHILVERRPALLGRNSIEHVPARYARRLRQRLHAENKQEAEDHAI